MRHAQFLKLTCSFFVVSLLCTQILGQAGFPQIPDPKINTSVIQPSPDAASITQYGSFPVTKYMGKANVEIPLAQISLPRLKVPVSLSYNYTGYRPAYEATSVGLGWDIQAGGSITRIVKDKVDEFAVKKWEDIPAMQLYTDNQQVLKEAVENNNSAISTTWDLQPDVYSFSFMGYSGSFILVKGSGVLFPHQSIVIKKVNDDIYITTPDGTTAEFKTKEITTSPKQNGLDLTLPFISAWHLTTLKAIDNSEIVEFSYTNWVYNNRTVIQSETYMKRIGRYAGKSNPGGLTPEADQTIRSMTTGPTIIQAKRLSEITSRATKITFVPDVTPRLDFSGGTAFAIKEVKITDRILNVVTSKAVLDFGYIGDNRNMILSALTLKSFNSAPTGINSGLQDQNYQFDYNSISLGSNVIERGIDVWGYYNGASNNSLFNKEALGVIYTPVGGNADRSVKYDKLMHGMLTKVTYPTKGFSEFEYEVNKVRPLTAPTVVYDDVTTSIVCSNPQPNNTLPIIARSCVAEDEFVIEPMNGNNFQTVTIVVERDLSHHTNPSQQKNQIDLFYIYDVNNLTTPVYTFPRMAMGIATDSTTVTLNTGTYTYRAQCEWNALKVTGTIKFKKLNQNGFMVDGPGLRIKSIKSYDNITKPNGFDLVPVSVKKYEYPSPAITNQNITGAELVGTMRHSGCRDGCAASPFEADEYTYSSSPSNPVPLGLTASYYYPEVVEINLAANVNGKTVTKFANPNFTVAGVQMVEERVFDATGKLLQKTKNTHSTQQLPVWFFDGTARQKFQYYASTGCGYGFPSPPCDCSGVTVLDRDKNLNKTFDLKIGLFYPYYNQLVEEKTTTYDAQLNESEVTKVYEYNNPNHTSPTKIIYSNSKGESNAVVTKYPLDYDYASCVKQMDELALFVNQRQTLGTAAVNAIGQRNATVLQMLGMGAGVCTAFPPNVLSFLDQPVNNHEEIAIANYAPIVQNFSSISDRFTNCVSVAIGNSNLSLFQKGAGNLVRKNVVGVPMEQYSVINKAGTNFIKSAVRNVYSLNYPVVGAPNEVFVAKPAPSALLESNYLNNPDSYLKKEMTMRFDVIGNLREQFLESNMGYTYLYDYDNQYPTAQVINANLGEAAYSSFEYVNTSGVFTQNSGWAINGGQQNSNAALIGRKSFSFAGSSVNEISRELIPSKKFVVSFWSLNSSASFTVKVNTNTTTVNDVAAKRIVKNGWTYYEYQLALGATDVSIGSSGGIIDELRCYPFDAEMTNYCYEIGVGQSAIVSPNNKFQYFIYDDAGKLAFVKDDAGNIIKRFCYNLSGQPDICPVACANTTANWQNTATALRCQVNANNVNTGVQEQEQMDTNNCSPSYSQLRWVAVGTNTTACPLPVGVNLTSTNTYGTAGFIATYTPVVGNGTPYVFNVTAATGLQALGTIPAGLYNLSITRPSGPLYAMFKSGCFKGTITGTSADFFNVDVSICNSITINLEN